MPNPLFDSFIIGQPTLDINTDYDGTEVRAYGGAVVYSGFAAGALGHQVAVLPKAAADINLTEAFAGAKNLTVMPLKSSHSTSIANHYHTKDRERRTAEVLSRIPPYQPDEIPDVAAAIYHVAGLMAGDTDEAVMQRAAQKAKVAVDVQCMLRHDENGKMVYRDWPQKQAMLPLIHFLKTDAAEAEILTGLTNRKEAAKQLHAWGAKEIMITHNSEVLVYNGNQYYTQPLKPRGLTGRTGRGDTCFAGYINERLTQPIHTALRTAAALVSLKMETPGPFMGTREDVERFAAVYYPQEH